MQGARIAWTTAIGTLLAGCVTAPQMHGPMPVRNQHPAQLTVMHMPPAQTSTLPAETWAGRVDLAYSSLFLGGAAPGTATSFRMDGEYLRVSPQLRVGLGSGFEVGCEVPFAHTSGGFLDSFLIDYHETFGLPDQNRSEARKNAFRVTATEGGQKVWEVEPSSIELLDVPAWLTWQCTEARDGGLGVALRAGFELPTGDADRGYGNGEVDYSAGVLLEQRLGGTALYGHLQHTFVSTDGSSAANLPFADVTSMGLGAELPLMERLHALVAVEFETSTLRNLDVSAVERDQVLLWVGARWQCGEQWAIELALGEDLQTAVSPDFTAWLGFTTVRSAPGPGGKP